MQERIPLDLYAEVESASGAFYKWDANQPAGSRLRNVSISTKIGEGFSVLTGTLSRNIKLDYPDLRLGQRITVVCADGHVVFEGRLAAMPREVADTHAISVTFVGHMAHAKDRRFSEVYVDRDLSGWQDMSATRRADLLVLNQSPSGPAVYSDPTDSTAGIETGFDGNWVSPYKPTAEAWYDAGAASLVAKIAFTWTRLATVDHTDTNLSWNPFVADNDQGANGTGPGNLRAAGPSTSTYTPATPRRWAGLQFLYNATPGGTAGAHFGLAWTKLAVYGNHGLTLHTGEPGEPDGVYASDVLRDIVSRFCPQLNTDGVEDSDYVIQHLKFQRTFPHDALLELNKYHLRHLAVWENRTLHFRPYDLSEYDWEIRTDDHGTTFSPVGLSVEDLFNGITVIYNDLLTGTEYELSPADETDLRDTSLDNPWNEWGIDHWDELVLSAPTTREQALQIGRAALAEKNRPKTPGTLTVKGYIRDRAGEYQPASKPRAGDVICITDFNEVNRLIVETDWDDESKTLRVAVDLPFQLLEALFDRQANARQARGLAA